MLNSITVYIQKFQDKIILHTCMLIKFGSEPKNTNNERWNIE